MGLRVYRYTPWTTNEDAKLALTGFTVVLARRNATIPAMAMPWPTPTRTTAQSTRARYGICTRPATAGVSHIRSARISVTMGGGTFSSSMLISLQDARSNQHRLLGEDARHRAMRRCLGDRGQEGRREVAGGVDAGHAGLAALVDLEDDAAGRIGRGEAQGFVQACGRLVARLGEQDVDRDMAAGIEIDGGDAALVVGDLDDPAVGDRDVATRQIGLDIGRNVVTIGEDGQLVGPIEEQPDLIVRLRAGPDDAPMLAGDFKAVAVGAGHDGRAPAFGKAWNFGHLVGDAIAQDQAARREAFAIGSEDGEIVDGAGDAVGPGIDQLDRGITRQLLPRLDQDVQRWLVIVAEQAMRVACEAIARQAGIENGDLAAGTAELQGGGEAGKAAADDDDVIHGDGLRVVDGGARGCLGRVARCLRCRGGAAGGLPCAVQRRPGTCERRTGCLPAPCQRREHVEGAQSASGRGPVFVDVPGLGAHPGTAEAGDAGCAGKQGSSARGRTGLHGGLRRVGSTMRPEAVSTRRAREARAESDFFVIPASSLQPDPLSTVPPWLGGCGSPPRVRCPPDRLQAFLPGFCHERKSVCPSGCPRSRDATSSAAWARWARPGPRRGFWPPPPVAPTPWPPPSSALKKKRRTSPTRCGCPAAAASMACFPRPNSARCMWCAAPSRCCPAGAPPSWPTRWSRAARPS